MSYKVITKNVITLLTDNSMFCYVKLIKIFLILSRSI